MDEDNLKFGVDIHEYLHLKSQVTVQRFKEIIGENIGSCTKEREYELLKYIVSKDVFEEQTKGTMRKSFLQEILDVAEECRFRVAMQNYINANNMASDL